MVGAAGTHDLDHDTLPVRYRERMSLGSRLALFVIAVQDVIPVAEPRFRNRAVTRYTESVLEVEECTVA